MGTIIPAALLEEVMMQIRGPVTIRVICTTAEVYRHAVTKQQNHRLYILLPNGLMLCLASKCRGMHTAAGNAVEH